jgi:hypothetical protein
MPKQQNSRRRMKRKFRPPADPRLSQAIARGMAVKRRLVEAEGGSLSTRDTSRQLRVSKVTLLKRYRNGRLIAWREEGQKALRFPAWQFRGRQVLAGLGCALRILNAGVRLDDYGRILFFLSKLDFLNGSRALDCLRNREVNKVIQAAHWFCQK